MGAPLAGYYCIDCGCLSGVINDDDDDDDFIFLSSELLLLQMAISVQGVMQE